MISQRYDKIINLQKKLFFYLYLRPLMEKGVVKYRLIRSLMPVLFLWYMVSISSFYHSHTVGGVQINHSHPFSKEHQHSQHQIDTLSLLSNWSALGEILPNLQIGSLFALGGVLLIVLVPSFYREVSSCYKRFRAPPVMSASL